MNEAIPGPLTEDRLREMEAALAARMELLERGQERFRRKSAMLAVGASVLAGASALLLIINLTGGAGGTADVVRARSFVLEDAQGRARGVLETTEDGTSRLVLQDRAGRDRARLTLLPDGSPGFTLADEQGRSRIVLGLLPDRTVNLVLADTRGRARVILGSGEDDETSLLFTDEQGASRAVLAVDAAGDPNFTLFERAAAPATAEDPLQAVADSTGMPGPM